MENQNTIKSTVQISIIEAKLLRDTELIGKMDPFVTVRYKKQFFRTRTIDEGGTNPTWSETFVLQLDSDEVDGEVHITCEDEDLLTNDFIGETKLPLKLIVDEDNMDTIRKWIPLFFKQKKSGDLLIQTILMMPET